MTLKDDLIADAFGRNWTAMTDEEVATDMNIKNRTRIRASMSGDEIFQQTDKTEFSALTSDMKQLWVSFCARDVIDPGAAANVDFVRFIFGSGATFNALKAARTETISLGVELGYGRVRTGHVQEARR